MQVVCKHLLTVFLVCLLLGSSARACTGRASQQSKGPRQSTPLALRQRVPNVSENTLGASGPPDERIHRDNPKFDELLPSNTNEDIMYKDEEGTGADRRMSKRCKDKLNSLAISVMNQWPGILLRVTEAWDEDGHHDENSLHYEGRAVDITTSDKDRSKYGMLARLAVEAGFDWVSFESKTWVHCSVKSDSSEAAKSGGCFPADSLVTLQNGETRTMADLRIGDKVKVVDKSSGLVTHSDVITFLDRDPAKDTLYRVIRTDRPGYAATLTPQHVLYASDMNSSFADSRAVFASDVHSGQYLYTTVHDHDRETKLVPARVTEVSTVRKTGAVAPLTYHGTLVVDGVAASNYAVLDVDWVTHGVFAPLRWWHSMRQYLGTPAAQTGLPYSGQIHWYPAFLYRITKPVVGSWYHADAIDV